MSKVSIRFYHLTKTTLEQSLPAMLEKTMEREKRATLILGSQEHLQALNTLLWIYNDHGFLPHGSEAEGHPEHQPVWLTLKYENLNHSNYAFFADGSFPENSEQISDLEICSILFNGLDEHILEKARELWRTLKKADCDLTYWQQTRKGWKQG